MKKPSKPKKPKTPATDQKKKAKKKKYKVRNWKAYNEMLVNRGRLMVHISPEALEGWVEIRTGEPGHQQQFSDTAIETVLSIQQYFRLPLRAAEGVVSRMLTSLGSTVKAPDYSTLCKRAKTLTVDIRVRERRSESIHLVVDSSGIKVYGEGEWKTRQHGISKRRTWKKIHLGFDADMGDVVAADVTHNDTHDSQVFPNLLQQVSEKITQVSNDGAYDTHDCYDAIAARGAKAVIPPRKDAKIWIHGNTNAGKHARDENLRRIRKVGRKQWKIDSGYHRRSHAENGFFRYKTIFGDRVSARTNENQRTALLLRVKILNRFTLLGMPESYAVTA